MKLENLAKANELANSILDIDTKIGLLNNLDFSLEHDNPLRLNDDTHPFVTLSAADIGPGKAAEIQNELWDALLKTKADLTAELEKL